MCWSEPDTLHREVPCHTARVLFFFASNVMECLGHGDAWAGKRRAVLPGKKLECGISGGFSSHERKEGPPPTHAKEKMACIAELGT
jgi:hypothetical protein